MAKHVWKGFMMAGLLGLTGLAVGCTERQEAEVREDAREVGQEIDNTADEAANEVEGAARDVNEELREGTGGAGDYDDVDIGEREGVINDGEGPFEQRNEVGEDNILEDNEGPLEDNENR